MGASPRRQRRRFAINRSKLLEEVLREHGWEAGDGADDVDFAMWDAKSRPHIPAPSAARLRCLTGRDSYQIDNKRAMWAHLRATCRDLLPETYSDAGDAAAAVRDTSGVWFLKKGHTAGGKDIVVGTWDEAVAAWRAADKPRDWVLQRAVPDPLPVGGRKGTLRCYVLWLPSRAVALWEDGLVVVHRSPIADADPACYDAHVDHHGCERRRLSAESYAERLWAPLRSAVARCFACYQRMTNTAGDPSRYHLFGADFIISAPEGEGGPLLPMLIEVNQFPNLSIRSDPVGRAVKRELFEDMYRFLIAPACDGAEPAPGRFVVVAPAPPADAAAPA